MHLVTGALGNQQEKDYVETGFNGRLVRRRDLICGHTLGIRSFPACTNAAGVNWKSHGVRAMTNIAEGEHIKPFVNPPTLTGRIEAAFMTLACQGDPGLRTKMTLMYPSTDIDKQSCLKYATIVLTRISAASLLALPPSQIEMISTELAEYLASGYECP